MSFRFLVEGRVQGVGFRSFVLTQAEMRTLSGEVWNTRDGRVEGIVVGAEDAVLLDFRDQLFSGPGKVSQVDWAEIKIIDRYTGFRVSQTR